MFKNRSIVEDWLLAWAVPGRVRACPAQSRTSGSFSTKFRFCVTCCFTDIKQAVNDGAPKNSCGQCFKHCNASRVIALRKRALNGMGSNPDVNDRHGVEHVVVKLVTLPRNIRELICSLRLALLQLIHFHRLLLNPFKATARATNLQLTRLDSFKVSRLKLIFFRLHPPAPPRPN